jgi:hypothetical protein
MYVCTYVWRMTISSLHLEGKGKDKVHPRAGHEGQEWEQRYSSTLSLTSALEGVGGQRNAPAVLTPGKTRYPLYRRLGGPKGRSRRLRKISPPPGFDPRTVQPVASCYTDWATPAHPLFTYVLNFRDYTEDLLFLSVCVPLLYATYHHTRTDSLLWRFTVLPVLNEITFQCTNTSRYSF